MGRHSWGGLSDLTSPILTSGGLPAYWHAEAVCLGWKQRLLLSNKPLLAPQASRGEQVTAQKPEPGHRQRWRMESRHQMGSCRHSLLANPADTNRRRRCVRKGDHANSAAATSLKRAIA